MRPACGFALRNLTRRLTLPGVTGVPPEAFDDAEQILRSALAGDSDGVADTFDKVVDRSGMAGAYDVAWCLAATMVGEGVRGGTWTLDFPDIDQVAYDARWVARFVSAYVNQDASTGAALFGAALEDGQLSDCLLTLAGSAVATLRHRR